MECFAPFQIVFSGRVTLKEKIRLTARLNILLAYEMSCLTSSKKNTHKENNKHYFKVSSAVTVISALKVKLPCEDLPSEFR